MVSCLLHLLFKCWKLLDYCERTKTFSALGLVISMLAAIVLITKEITMNKHEKEAKRLMSLLTEHLNEGKDFKCFVIGSEEIYCLMREIGKWNKESSKYEIHSYITIDTQNVQGKDITGLICVFWSQSEFGY